jgi:hypothetical protein
LPIPTPPKEYIAENEFVGSRELGAWVKGSGLWGIDITPTPYSSPTLRSTLTPSHPHPEPHPHTRSELVSAYICEHTLALPSYTVVYGCKNNMTILYSLFWKKDIGPENFVSLSVWGRYVGSGWGWVGFIECVWGWWVWMGGMYGVRTGDEGLWE